MGLPARKLHPDGERRIEEVTLSRDGRRLIFIFENGEGYSLPRTDLPGDDGTPVTALQIFDHRGAVAVTQASGQVYDLPWDSIKHYAQGGKQKKVLLGNRLKRLREEKTLTQTGLARSAGISRMQLARIEANDSTPGFDTLLKLVRVLGISPRELLL